MSLSRRAFAILSIMLMLGLFGLAAQEATLPERLMANAISLGTGGQAGFVQITIERWSTPEERQALVDAFAQKGADGLLSALQQAPPVGVVRTPNTLGWDLHYAFQVPAEGGGRRILIATDRAITFFEASRNSRSEDYPFTLIELHLDKDSKGEGRMALATKIKPGKDGKHIELENYGSEPVRLKNVRPQKK